MVDPRIKRTHSHVFFTIKKMADTPSGIPRSLSDLANAAEMSRRTVSQHWGSIADVLADAIMTSDSIELFEESDSTEDRIRIFLMAFRNDFHQPLVYAAMLALASARKVNQNPSTNEKLFAITRTWMHYFESEIGPITEEQYACLVGPLVFQEMLTTHSANDELIESLVQLGRAIMIPPPSTPQK